MKRGYSNGTIQSVLTYDQPIVNTFENSRIDAAYRKDKFLFFIQGNKTIIWDPYKPNKRMDRLPKGEKSFNVYTNNALPGLKGKQPISTAFVWPNDDKLYVFQGKYFYIWDESNFTLDGLYDISQWKNVCKVNICRHGQFPNCVTPETKVAPVKAKKTMVVST